MKKKLFSREFRVGILAIAAIFILYFGLNFLNGIDIFTSTNSFYTHFERTNGLVKSAPVTINGFKVGQVDAVEYDFSKTVPFVVKISVPKDIKLAKGTRLELYDDGLMGGKAIRIIMDTPTAYDQNTHLHKSGDTIQSTVSPGLMDMLSAEFLPKVSNVITQADSLLFSLRQITESSQLAGSLQSIEKSTANLEQTSAQLKRIMSTDVPEILGNVKHLSSDFKTISGNLKEIDFASTFASIDSTINNLNLVSQKLTSNDNNIGLLLNDKELYNNLLNTTESANNLLIDLQKNPKKYVHFSVFGKK